MEKSQAKRRNRTHDPIQHDEIRLVLHNAIRPTTRHLCNTEHAPREDGQVRQRDGAREEAEVGAAEERGGGGREGGAVPVGAQHVVAY